MDLVIKRAWRLKARPDYEILFQLMDGRDASDHPNDDLPQHDDREEAKALHQ